MSLSESKLLQAYRKMRQIRALRTESTMNLPRERFQASSIFMLARKPPQLASACTSTMKTDRQYPPGSRSLYRQGCRDQRDDVGDLRSPQWHLCWQGWFDAHSRSGQGNDGGQRDRWCRASLICGAALAAKFRKNGGVRSPLSVMVAPTREPPWSP